MNYNYSIENFKTGREYKSNAKKDLWSLIAKDEGGWPCLYNVYEQRLSTNSWKKYRLNGMQSYIHKLTNQKYRGDLEGERQVNNVAGTLAYQFKINFEDIYMTMTGTSTSSLDEYFGISSNTKQKNIPSSEIDKAKVYKTLAEIHSSGFSKQEIDYIRELLET